ncbi:hypothetical protein ACN4EG_04490 [Alkalinema pantanalense CENA528]|uniref:hypothetical protein n=1 Tax=Alkalinema pantanalense TaxID=1620705 RepID=UPI003D6E4CD0
MHTLLVPENLPQHSSHNVLNENRDIAGSWVSHPNYLHTRARITTLLDRYLSSEQLSYHLTHFTEPAEYAYSCPWKATPLHVSNQVIGIDRELFVQVLTSLMQVEPISDECVSAYLEEWLQTTKITKSLPPIAPDIQTALKELLDLDYFANDLSQQLYHRITHTGSAISIYFWLMAHSTGDLQQAIVHLLQSEIYQLARVWGLSRWALGGKFLVQLQRLQQEFLTPFDQAHEPSPDQAQDQTSSGEPIHSSSASIPLLQRLPMTIELTFTFLQVMVRLQEWNRQLHPIALKSLFEQSLFEPEHFSDLVENIALGE